jgi:hypothetical protein
MHFAEDRRACLAAGMSDFIEMIEAALRGQ